VDAVNRPEEALHRAGVAYLRAALPSPWIVFHVPNGGGRSKAEAGILKAMGVLAGMPDLFVCGPHKELEWAARGPAPRLIAIEFKAPPKRLRTGGPSKAKPRLSPAQIARQIDLGACGVPYLVIDDLADLVQSLKALGVPLRGRAM
jgi:hypothetical protein